MSLDPALDFCLCFVVRFGFIVRALAPAVTIIGTVHTPFPLPRPLSLSHAFFPADFPA
jgi:hypothetical protein